MSIDEQIIEQLTNEIGPSAYSNEWVSDTANLARSRIADLISGTYDDDSPEITTLGELFEMLDSEVWYKVESAVDNPNWISGLRETQKWYNRAIEITLGRILPGPYQSYWISFLA
jgi:hypothetical protein